MCWTGLYFNGPSPGVMTGVTISFWADAANTPGGFLGSTAVVGNANETFNSSVVGVDIYDTSALINPFVAVGGTQYWMSIVPDVTQPPQWGWATSAAGDGTSYQDFFGTRGVRNEDMAFTLKAAPVPEPFTMVLAAAGLAAAARRRKQKTA